MSYKPHCMLLYTIYYICIAKVDFSFNKTRKRKSTFPIVRAGKIAVI